MFFKKLLLHHTAHLIGTMLIIQILCPAGAKASTAFDYDQMVAYIRNAELQEPLVLLADSQGEFDRRLNQANLAYLNQNPQLLENIQQRLAVDSLRWKLNESSKRLLVVPEQRQAYADLFEQYCKTAVDTALALTGLTNPFVRISTLKGPLPPVNPERQSGVTAYIVHNIADEYVEEYLFYNPESDSKKIKIQLRNRVFTGKIGSYTSRLTIGENSTVRFEREPYTLWQNNAINPVNVFVAPVEETLHIALRDATERVIKAKVAHKKPRTIEEVENIVEEWIAVEEAAVGGLVTQVMPIIFKRFVPGLLDSELSESMHERDAHRQYRYLHDGVRVVSEMGIRTSVDLYTTDPEQFKQMVCPPNIAAPPAGEKSAQES